MVSMANHEFEINWGQKFDYNTGGENGGKGGEMGGKWGQLQHNKHNV